MSVSLPSLEEKHLSSSASSTLIPNRSPSPSALLPSLSPFSRLEHHLSQSSTFDDVSTPTHSQSASTVKLIHASQPVPPPLFPASSSTANLSHASPRVMKHSASSAGSGNSSSARRRRQVILDGAVTWVDEDVLFDEKHRDEKSRELAVGPHGLIYAHPLPAHMQTLANSHSKIITPSHGSSTANLHNTNSSANLISTNTSIQQESLIAEHKVVSLQREKATPSVVAPFIGKVPSST